MLLPYFGWRSERKIFMIEILKLLPVLAIAVAMNIGTGLYYSMGTKKLDFRFPKLLHGIFKAGIISLTFIGLAYCFEATDLSSIGVTPEFILTSAIALYITKAIHSLGKILGIEIVDKPNGD